MELLPQVQSKNAMISTPPFSETDDPPLIEMPELSGDCPSDVSGPSEDANVDFDPEAASILLLL